MEKNVLTWKILLLLLVTVIVSCEAQTFQYSRGWTNGKRSGGVAPSFSFPVPGQVQSQAQIQQLLDLENGLLSLGLPFEEQQGSVPLSVPMHLSLGPQARFRSLDNNQILNRKLGSTGSAISRKQPMWIGTIMGLEQEPANSLSSSSSRSSSSNPNPNSNSNTNPNTSNNNNNNADF